MDALQNNDSAQQGVNFNLLFLGLLILLLGGPFIHQYGGWSNSLLLELIFGTASLLFLLSFAKDLRVFVLGLIPASLTVVFSILAVVFDKDVFRYSMQISAFAFCLFAIRYSALEVFLSGAVDLNKIIGSICIYLLLVVAWAIVYDFLELVTPGSFAGLSETTDLSRFDEFSYFSLVTITTLGYGDITPENSVAGITAGLQATAGVFYSAVLV
ncbi:ion channel, partial [Marinobacter alexandrii]|uniref:ion channel n=1 Tax=Marinobacter alexandrii TaxID=2570351 RepID=UPI00329739A5